MKQHVSIVAALFIVFGVLGFVGACCVLAVLVGSGLIPLFVEGEELPFAILSTIAVIGSVFMVLFSIPDIIAGVGLMKYKSWARYLAIILGVLSVVNLAAFPISTIFGIYTLWVMLQDETEVLLSNGG